MPTSPPRVCAGCGHAVHGRCPNCSTTGWRKNPDAAWAGGSTRRWRRFRAGWLAEHPMCAECPALAAAVDHVKNLATFPAGEARERARFDPANVQSLCGDCHKRKTARESAVARARAVHAPPDEPPALF